MELKAVNNVSFEIKKGEVFGLVGESGCGKTTTGRTIIKLYNATSGNVYFKGKRIVAGTRSYKDAIKAKRIEANKALEALDQNDPEYTTKRDAIKAEKLEYKTITDALVSGNFYASQGPEIHNVWFEDGVVHIECSDVKTIRFNTGVRYAKRIIAKDGESICSAEFPIKPDDKYVRITITDADGKYAYTNAYFTDELFD